MSLEELIADRDRWIAQRDCLTHNSPAWMSLTMKIFRLNCQIEKLVKHQKEHCK